MKNNKVIQSFGNEWSKFDQTRLKKKELKKIFNDYFCIFPFNKISKKSTGFDMGCGTGRWSVLIAPKVKKLNCIEPSKAIYAAKKNLKNYNNVNFINESIEKLNLQNNSQDFGYCLGVLHHLKNTKKGIKLCSRFLKKGAPFLAYIYYSFENKNLVYRSMWRLSNLLRKVICNLPEFYKSLISDILAVIIYFPLAKLSFFLNKLNISVSRFPLNYYKDLSFYTMRTDSRDRFGTSIEGRFSKKEIIQMFKEAGFERIKFSNKEPFWCVLGYKKF